ncbi:hypothetical protein BDF20DRAFT_992288 [Mycotypha africana]|uniref:uncharacterized protein n=1 Tax=Mycotypha africana TaxID=64632 RepID=UPI0023006531|nr:uncharacterized protein BDF20DRAFT_992288 [Mycotypha africana]KAI8967049.1 hypothetical protein BDF20DRAFT_992288 [Mycotypha africana]
MYPVEILFVSVCMELTTGKGSKSELFLRLLSELERQFRFLIAILTVLHLFENQKQLKTVFSSDDLFKQLLFVRMTSKTLWKPEILLPETNTKLEKRHTIIPERLLGFND